MAVKKISPEKVLALELTDETLRRLQNPKGSVAAETAKREIAKVMRDKKHHYHHPEHGAAHRAAVAAVQALHQIGYDDGAEPVEVAGLLKR